jgi:hypothetical protein
LSAAVVLVLALVAFPLGVLASHQYSDVPDSNPFHGDITAITNAGVTSGCGGGKYCPDRNVTRAEMAAFMNRLGALAANKTPVVNADKLDGYQANGLVRAAYAGVSDSARVGSNGTVLTAYITAPSAGYLLISASSDVYNTGSGDSPECYLKVDGDSLLDSFREMGLTGAATATNEENCETDGSMIVCAGDHTVYLEGTMNAGTTFDEAHMNVLFVPFGPSGGSLTCL